MEFEADEDVTEYCFENLKNISQSENKKIIILCDNLEEVFKSNDHWNSSEDFQRNYSAQSTFL